jgi:transposase-like protein
MTEVWAKCRELAAEQKQSGQSVAAFCRERGLKSGQFFAWKKRLRGWHGVEHLLNWSQWPRKHQFHALVCPYRKQSSPLPTFYLQL